ncbi:MAG: class I SAM-dependent methyltransferase [Chloroflexi bacterium]|uniref:Class I SAM-dependent methyltransferase n=1 Tax=Candidatus Chlorohelix allophototropha TaxID=3003348 RepID=A0A8T7M971_9CHLR|nr:class I SAM-dependent methyltransferase [Chloroflexota bacterium]WJW68605.1 class I SAM-dependent methyltransferase [Chloroflexota bacterium L227-S17]
MPTFRNIAKTLPGFKNLYKYIQDLETARNYLQQESRHQNKHIQDLETARDYLQQEFRQLNSTVETLAEQVAGILQPKSQKLFVPVGHFYSPFPAVEEIKQQEAEIFDKANKHLPAIELNEPAQVALLLELSRYFSDWPFSPDKSENLRYYQNNDFFGHWDALSLYSILRHLKPPKLFEIGSGFSSALMLDTNELFLDNSIELTFIEPYPERLLLLLGEEEKKRIRLFQQKLQDVPLDKFRELEAGDILFIDSTHVAKTGSDVNYILFHILPALNKGVYIHFHDVFYPFEYVSNWVYEGRGWNEAYMLRAFLEYNKQFEIYYFVDFVQTHFSQLVKDKLPPTLQQPLGASLWLKKLED